jgi:S-adenosylmethionine hydrolase
VAAAVARGVAVTELAATTDHFVMLRDVPSVSIEDGRVRGTGRYADRFGNVLTDIPLAAVRRVCPAGARVTVGGRDAGPLRRTYADAGHGELLAIVNAWDRIEAAVNAGRAIDRLGGGPPATIHFEIRPG